MDALTSGKRGLDYVTKCTVESSIENTYLKGIKVYILHYCVLHVLQGWMS